MWAEEGEGDGCRAALASPRYGCLAPRQPSTHRPPFHLWQVADAPPHVQRRLAPALASPGLRRLLESFAADDRGDVGAWAANPRVLDMLEAAAAALAEGRLREEELGAALAGAATAGDSGGASGAQGGARCDWAPAPVRLPPDALAAALNEHVRTVDGEGVAREWGGVWLAESLWSSAQPKTVLAHPTPIRPSSAGVSEGGQCRLCSPRL